MTGLNTISEPARPAAPNWRQRQLTHSSSTRENVFEHILLGQIGAELLARGVEYDELHSSVDKDGYDVLLEAGSISRHTQLKVMVLGGKRSEIIVHQHLGRRPSGCVVWLTYDPVTRSFSDIRWFGNAPGEPLPDLGNRIARNTRGNKDGKKGERPNHRVLPARRFERLQDIPHLVDRLFGRVPADPLGFLRSRLPGNVPAGPEWLAEVADGNFAAIPSGIDWSDSAELGGLIDGYRLLELLGEGEPASFLDRQRAAQHETGVWPGDAAVLWTTAFLELRASRFGESDPSDTRRLDLLIAQLRGALVSLEEADA